MFRNIDISKLINTHDQDLQKCQTSKRSLPSEFHWQQGLQACYQRPYIITYAQCVPCNVHGTIASIREAQCTKKKVSSSAVSTL